MPFLGVVAFGSVTWGTLLGPFIAALVSIGQQAIMQAVPCRGPRVRLEDAVRE